MTQSYVQPCFDHEYIQRDCPACGKFVSENGQQLSGWASQTLGLAYMEIEKLRDGLAQPVESGISESLDKALDAIETADCELEATHCERRLA